MRSDWKYKLKIVLLLPVIAFCSMGNKCLGGGGGGNSGNTTVTPPNKLSVYNIEYDYVINDDVFLYGDAYAVNAFVPCSTTLSVYHDDMNMPAVAVQFNDLFYYMEDHAERDIDSNLMYNSQLVGMDSALNIVSGSGFQVIASTWFDQSRDTVRTAIFVQLINNLTGHFQSMLEKTVIHELGHNRGDLPHLCFYSYGTYYQYNSHNDPSCVMGTGRYSLCGGNDLTTNPHFCSNDRDSLKKIK